MFAFAGFDRVERRAAEVQLLQQVVRCDTAGSRCKCVVVCGCVVGVSLMCWPAVTLGAFSVSDVTLAISCIVQKNVK